MAKAKTKKEVAEKATDEAVETKGATEDGKLKVKKKKPSIKSMEINDEPIKVDLSKPKTEEKDEPVQESKQMRWMFKNKPQLAKKWVMKKKRSKNKK